MGHQLRSPTPPPEVEGFAGRREELGRIVELLRSQLFTRQFSPARQPPNVVVLHGPAGVGKSALAAEACRQLDVPAHWFSLDDATNADVERTLLRLLAEVGAPRAAILPMATASDRAFRRALRDQCTRYVGTRLLVLDGVAPRVGRALLDALRKCAGLTVLITSREASGWRRAGARLIGVTALDPFGAAAVATRLFLHSHPGLRSPPRDDLAAVAQGLPPLIRIVSALVANEVAPDRIAAAQGPDHLVRLALQALGPDQERLLRYLGKRLSNTPFPRRTVDMLFGTGSDPSGVPAVLEPLLARQLVQRVRGADLFCLPEPVARAVRRWLPPVEPLTSQMAWGVSVSAGRALRATARLLDSRVGVGQSDGREPAALASHELASYIDELMGQLAHSRLATKHLEANAAPLAVVLAALGDAHRLVALRRLRPSPPVQRALGSLASDLGLPSLALALHAPRARAGSYDTQAYATTCFQSGLLDRAVKALRLPLPSGLSSEDVHTSWLLLLFGAVRCDQGELADAEQTLRRATALHSMADCPRGLGWARLHLARVHLLSGQDAEAEIQLDHADRDLGSVMDTRGQNWVATERIRLALVRGVPRTALELVRRAETSHAIAEDTRGRGWICLYEADAQVMAGDAEAALQALVQAEQHFLDCGDRLGLAWTRHRTALLSGDTRKHAGVSPFLHSAWELFEEIGCPVGTAWSELEMTARRKPSALNLPLLSQARDRFRALDDACGVAWVSAVETVHRHLLHRPARATAEAVIVSVPVDVPRRNQLIQEIKEFCRDDGTRRDRSIPFHARYTTAVRITSPESPEYINLPGPQGPRCRVRVTLLDDSPAEDATARLLVRVTPEEGHPWAAPQPDRPWLTVTAVPLTHASVDPASALLHPSEQAAHGAEFGFTAHRTGTHRIRFTIALERTGTVLQQVETELDILDHDRTGGRTAPEAVTHRGR